MEEGSSLLAFSSLLVSEPAETFRFNLFVTLFLFVEVMVGMGFTTEDIKDALLNQKYNEVTATYLLLGLKTEVIQPH